jgi:hypothetical protein
LTHAEVVKSRRLVDVASRYGEGSVVGHQQDAGEPGGFVLDVLVPHPAAHVVERAPRPWQKDAAPSRSFTGGSTISPSSEQLSSVGSLQTVHEASGERLKL